MTLKDLQEYYDSILVGKTYIYTLRPNKKKETIEIKIKFFKENLPHLLGIQKVVPSYEKKLYQGKRGYEGILNETITLEKLKGFDKQKAKKDKKIPLIEKKLMYFKLIDKLLLNCKIVKFYPDKITGFTSINSEFILYLDELGVRLHLGAIKNDNSKDILYYPETFIVTDIKRRGFDRFTKSPPQTYMNIESLRIINDDE